MSITRDLGLFLMIAATGACSPARDANVQAQTALQIIAPGGHGTMKQEGAHLETGQGNSSAPASPPASVPAVPDSTTDKGGLASASASNTVGATSSPRVFNLIDHPTAPVTITQNFGR